jgi:hypothetical protein
MPAKYFGQISTLASRNGEAAPLDLPGSDTSAPSRQQNGMRDWVAAVLIMAIFAVLQIRVSLKAGALAFPPTFDDVSYFLSGINYLKPFQDSSFAGVLRQYYLGPPHAPMSTALAFIGFSLLGIKAWVGPVVNAVVLVFFLRSFLAIVEVLPYGQAILLAIAILGFPLVGDALMTFRPDMFCSLAIAAGTLYIVLKADWLYSRRHQLIAGAIFGGALWAKPTVVHLAAALFGAAMLLASLPALRQRDIKTPLFACLVTAGTGVLISLPYYAVAFHQVVDYIWTTAFGAQASIWVKHIPLRDHLLYYLTGLVGANSLGLWLYAGPIIGIGAALVLWMRKDRDALYRAALVVVLVLLAYLTVTIPTFKGPHGLPFAALFLAATAVGAVALVRGLRQPLAWAACVALVLFSAWQFMWPFTRAHGVVDPAFAATRVKMLQEIVDVLGRDANGKLLYETTPLVYLNYSSIAFQNYTEGSTPPAGDLGMLIVDPEAQRQRIAAADFIFAVTPEAVDVFPHLPTASAEMRAETIKLIEASGRFEPPIRVADPLHRGDVLIYEAFPSFTHFEQEEGLGSVTGPDPRSNIRWGVGGQSAFVANGAPNSRAMLVIQVSGQGNPGQTLSILINGQPKQSATLSNGFTNFEVSFDFDPKGKAKILLRYGTAAGNAVLYRTLAVRPPKT